MPPIASFEEEKQVVPKPAQEPRGMIGFLVRRGWAKDASSAAITLVALAVVCGAAALLFAFQGAAPGEYRSKQETNAAMQKMRDATRTK